MGVPTAHVVAGPLRTDQLIVGTLMWQLAAPEDHVSRATMRSYSASAAAAVEAIRRPELDRRLARTYQESLLPPELPDVGDLELVGRYRSAMAADRSGGDWYDVVPQRDGANVLIVGDAVGHGIDAAVSMGHVRDVTRAAALELTAPSAILKRVDRYLDELDDGTMAAMTIVVVSPSGDHFSIATAANPGPFLRRPTGTVESIDSPAGPFVGSGLDPEYEEQRHRFEPGAALILVTDGVVQRKGGSIDDGERAAREALTAPFIDLDDLCTRLIDGNGAESGHDDMVVLAALRTV
jgi:serine phosphatase RsbU (regulator of sigma subunit)